MPVARTARQMAALRKAQLASARKRRGRGKAKPISRRRKASKVSKYAAVAAAGATAAAATYYGVKHGKKYVKKKKIASLRKEARKRVNHRNEMVTLYHRTQTAAAKNIVRTQRMHSKSHTKAGDAGDANHVWFADKKSIGLMSSTLGDSMVSVRVRRGTAQRWQRQAGRFDRGGGGWAAVSTSELRRHQIRGPGALRRRG